MTEGGKFRSRNADKRVCANDGSDSRADELFDDIFQVLEG